MLCLCSGKLTLTHSVCRLGISIIDERVSPKGKEFTWNLNIDSGIEEIAILNLPGMMMS